jgi:N-acetylglucosaminyldiphosphoundecaprenol N-acetyl-beta-D-mannosaminyltransferase
MGRHEGGSSSGATATGEAGGPAREARQRVRIGRLWIDHLTRAQALEEIRALVERGAGGAVFTPNVDHVVVADRDARLRGAYRRADLSFADGAPVVWASHLLRTPVPEKLSGSDLFEPIVALAARCGWRVYLLGGAPGSAPEAARRLEARYGVTIVGIDEARVSTEPEPVSDGEILARIRAARPDLILVGLGMPKQERWIDRMAPHFAPAVAIGAGACLDFVAGRVRRAPRWMSRVGLEWLFRLVNEPRRLWRRYLVRDPQFIGVVLRTWRLPLARRVQWTRAGVDASAPASATVIPITTATPGSLRAVAAADRHQAAEARRTSAAQGSRRVGS